MYYEELLPRFESSTSWSNHKEVYEKSSYRFHRVLFGRPYDCTMDDLPGPIPKGLVLFPKYNVFVILFLRFLWTWSGCRCNDCGRSSWTNISKLVPISGPLALVSSMSLSFPSTINYLLKD